MSTRPHVACPKLIKIFEIISNEGGVSKTRGSLKVLETSCEAEDNFHAVCA